MIQADAATAAAVPAAVGAAAVETVAAIPAAAGAAATPAAVGAAEAETVVATPAAVGVAETPAVAGEAGAAAAKAAAIRPTGTTAAARGRARGGTQ